jgi:hypothetical protein
MSETPSHLPNSELVRVLTRKASERVDSDYDFLGRLNDLRKRVRDDVRQINELFPEYTPHDEYYHLARLFHVADVLLGPERIAGMSCVEVWLKFDAISKFGIGILSCFMVAEEIEITTFKDPYVNSQGDALRIQIPSVQKFFRIEAVPRETTQIGTAIRVTALGRKLKDCDPDARVPLQVTEYLKIIAGLLNRGLGR